MSFILPPSSVLAQQPNSWLRRSSALKMAGAAFLAGAVLAGLALKLPGRSGEPATATAPAAATATAPQPAAAPASPAVAAAAKPDAPTARPAQAVPCEQQAWPYVDKSCGTAKPRLAATGPEPASGAPARVIAPEREAVPPANETTTADTNSGEAAANPEPVTFPATEPEAQRLARLARVPLPRPRPAGLVPPAEAAPAVPGVTVAAPRAPKRAPVVAATDPDEEPDAVTAVEPSKPALRESRHSRRASRRAERRRLARAPAELLQEQNEADGFQLVQQRMLPDGRRISVYRRYEEPPPRMAFGEPFRRPFSWPGF